MQDKNDINPESRARKKSGLVRRVSRSAPRQQRTARFARGAPISKEKMMNAIRIPNRQTRLKSENFRSNVVPKIKQAITIPNRQNRLKMGNTRSNAAAKRIVSSNKIRRTLRGRAAPSVNQVSGPVMPSGYRGFATTINTRAGNMTGAPPPTFAKVVAQNLSRPARQSLINKIKRANGVSQSKVAQTSEMKAPFVAQKDRGVISIRNSKNRQSVTSIDFSNQRQVFTQGKRDTLVPPINDETKGVKMRRRNIKEVNFAANEKFQPIVTSREAKKEGKIELSADMNFKDGRNAVVQRASRRSTALKDVHFSEASEQKANNKDIPQAPPPPATEKQSIPVPPPPIDIPPPPSFVPPPPMRRPKSKSDSRRTASINSSDELQRAVERRRESLENVQEKYKTPNERSGMSSETSDRNSAYESPSFRRSSKVDKVTDFPTPSNNLSSVHDEMLKKVSQFVGSGQDSPNIAELMKALKSTGEGIYSAEDVKTTLVNDHGLAKEDSPSKGKDGRRI